MSVTAALQRIAELEALLAPPRPPATPAPPPGRFAEALAQAQGAAAPLATAAVTAPAPAGPTTLAWPLSAPVSSGYGPRWGRSHEGIDVAAPTGTPVGAAAAGQVVFSGVQSGYGNIVVVRHGDGRETAYAHLSSLDVRVGDGVAQGQQLGRVGSTGRSTGPHLHFEVRVGGEAQDPLRHLPARWS